MNILNKKGESLIGIIIGVFLLSIVSLGVGALISNSRGLIESYEDKLVLDLLTSNSYKIIKNIDLSTLSDGDIFYLYKDITNPNDLKYKIFVGSINSDYKYINKFGDKVDANTYNKELFTRSFYFKKVLENGKNRDFIKLILKKNS